MAVVRKKQDDKYLKELRELVTTGGGNRQCFDCGQKGPTYVNMTIGSFVCTRCSGVLRGLTPPHRVKSISMATFTQEEIDFLKAHGNDVCAKTWLGLWDPKRASAQRQDHRELMIDKYERKRYYLEPASPLKSLTNAASLKSNSSSAAAATAAAASAATQNGNHNSSSNGNSTVAATATAATTTTMTNGYKQNSVQNIQLTPPTSQRTTANGLHKTAATTNTSAISRPQHQHQHPHNQHNQHQLQQPQQNGYHPHHQQHHHQDAFMLNNGLNGLSAGLNGGLNASSVGSASTGALSDTSSCASNGFGPDADFIADFGSANIFDATSASSVGSPAVSSASSVASTNGYAKIQPIKAAAHHQQQFMNGNGCNGNVKSQMNGTSSAANGDTENFADFDHAPIYNAAETATTATANAAANYKFIRKPVIKKSSSSIAIAAARKAIVQRQQSLISNSLFDADNGEDDFFANFNDAIGNSNSNGNFGSHTAKYPPDIRFSESTSLPIPNGNRNGSTSTSANSSFSNSNYNNNNNNNSSKLSSTPSEDRYAALKDLDEQLRESKAVAAAAASMVAATVVDSFGNAVNYNNNNNNNPNISNPFKSQQQQQQQHQQLSAALVNPLHAAQFQNLFGQMTMVPNGQQPQSTAATAGGFYNYPGTGPAMYAVPTVVAATPAGPNGCGFGFGTMQQQIAATGGGAFNNPFAATGALNSNNPFL